MVVDDDAARREIGPGNELYKLLYRCVWRLDQVQGGLAQLGGVVRRDRGRHADGDAVCAVGEEVRKRSRQDDGLLALTAVVWTEIDGRLVEAFEQRLRYLGQPRFRVAVGRRVVAVDIAEVPLALDQRIA